MEPAGPEPVEIGDVVADPHTLGHEDTLELLRTGVIEVEGRLVDASNATLFCALTGDGVQAACVYKPIMGERPLWDFPDGTLAGREVSAYLVSEALGWEVVPPTVLRDGPFGSGMVQLWVDGDAGVDLTRLVRANRAELRRMAVFDAVINNADRKGGHLIPMPDGRVYGVDHGVAFSPEDKLRTVLWRWAGTSLTDTGSRRAAGPAHRVRRRAGRAAGRTPHPPRGTHHPDADRPAARARAVTRSPPGTGRRSRGRRSELAASPGGVRALYTVGRCSRGRRRRSRSCPGPAFRCGCTTAPPGRSARPPRGRQPRCTSAGSRRTTRRIWDMPRRIWPSTW
ncbi:MAG: SCO1664 family protein [Candidatus Limnocylindrales bacterium]